MAYRLPTPSTLPHIAFLPNRKTVCKNHQLRKCGICRLDFTSLERDLLRERNKRMNLKDNEIDEEDELKLYSCAGQHGSQRSFSDKGGKIESPEAYLDKPQSTEEEDNNHIEVLSGCDARFIPQLDSRPLTFDFQPEISKKMTPIPPSTFVTHNCSICQLTWLIGDQEKPCQGPETHLSHHQNSGSACDGTPRSLVVFTCGRLLHNNYEGGIGVFFAQESKFNYREAYEGFVSIRDVGYMAIAKALERVRLQILPEREKMIESVARWKGNTWETAYEMRLRVVVLTEREDIIQTTSDQCQAFPEEYMVVQNEVQKLSLVGVQLVYHQVKSEDNPGAIMLALGSIVEKSLSDKEAWLNTWWDSEDEDEDEDDRYIYKEEEDGASEQGSEKWKREMVEWAEKTQMSHAEDGTEEKRKREQNEEPEEGEDFERETKRMRED